MFRFIFFPLSLLSVSLSILFCCIFWIWALISCIKSDLKDPDKVLWVLIIIFLNFIGALLYFILVRLNKNYKGFNLKMKTKNNIKRIYRSKKNRVIAGVCGGIGEYFNIDPTLVRLLWVLFAFAGGSGIIAYIIAWLIIPEEK